MIYFSWTWKNAAIRHRRSSVTVPLSIGMHMRYPGHTYRARPPCCNTDIKRDVCIHLLYRIDGTTHSDTADTDTHGKIRYFCNTNTIITHTTPNQYLLWLLY